VALPSFHADPVRHTHGVRSETPEVGATRAAHRRRAPAEQDRVEVALAYIVEPVEV
jgi:hypothetical protein